MPDISKIKYLPFYALSFLPMYILYIFSDLAFLMVYYVFKYRRKVVLTNLKNSFPSKSAAEIKDIEKDYYRHFCDILIESVKVLTIRTKEINKRFRVTNPELIQRIFESKKSIVLYTAHQGNWEFLAFLPLFIPFQVIAFYHPQSSKYFDGLMKILRQRFGVLCIESNKGYKTIMNFTQSDILTMSYIIGDQSPRMDSTKHWVNFLNQETAFLIGADRIAKKSNQVVIFPSYKKLKRGYYELEFKVVEEESIGKKNFEIIEKYAKLLEETIENSPEMWLWSHRRWKLTRQDQSPGIK